MTTIDLRQAAEDGEPDAAFALGSQYQDEGDLDAAQSWFLRAMEGGNLVPDGRQRA